MKQYKKNDDNNRLELINWFKSPIYNYCVTKLSDSIKMITNGSTGEIIGCINTLSELDEISKLSEIIFADSLDKCNLAYEFIEQDNLTFFSKKIKECSQRIDFKIYRDKKSYSIDVKCYKRYNGNFTLNCSIISKYNYYNDNINDLFIVFFDREALIYDKVFILKWVDLQNYLLDNPINSTFNRFIQVNSKLIKEIKLNDLNDYFV